MRKSSWNGSERLICKTNDRYKHMRAINIKVTCRFFWGYSSACSKLSVVQRAEFVALSDGTFMKLFSRPTQRITLRLHLKHGEEAHVFCVLRSNMHGI